MTWGVITWYVALVGAALFCGGTYDLDDAWLALPVEEFTTAGRAQCGDVYAVWMGGELLYLPARDAGGFGSYCVQDGDTCLDIVADIPQHVFPGPGLSIPGYIINSEQFRDAIVP